jgi:hypothetical protein
MELYLCVTGRCHAVQRLKLAQKAKRGWTRQIHTRLSRHLANEKHKIPWTGIQQTSAVHPTFCHLGVWVVCILETTRELCFFFDV